jgi:phosphoribosylanthranilate isomerase
MSSAPLVKICGLREEETLSAALEAGADFIGLVFYPPSPRHVDAGAAKNLAAIVKGYRVSKKVSTVGLFVDPSDQTLEEVLGRVALDMIQLHVPRRRSGCGLWAKSTIFLLSRLYL